MFDLKYASLALRKVVYTHGIRADRRNAWYKPVSNSEIVALIGDNKTEETEVTIFDLEYEGQMSWAELR